MLRPLLNGRFGEVALRLLMSTDRQVWAEAVWKLQFRVSEENSFLSSPSSAASAGTKYRSLAFVRTSFWADHAGPSFHTASAGSELEHHLKADDLGAGPEVAEGGACGHEVRLGDHQGVGKRFF